MRTERDRQVLCEMPDLLVTKVTYMKRAEVMRRAERFFTMEKWRVQSQNGNLATFSSQTGLPWEQVLAAALLTLCLVLPGIVYYARTIRKTRREQKIAVSTMARGELCEVVVSYPPDATELMTDFLAELV